MNLDGVILDVLNAAGQLLVDSRTLGANDDLFEAGLTSLTTVSVMLMLEDRLGIEIPDEALNRRTFSSIAALREALLPLLPPGAVAAASGAAPVAT